MNDNIAVIIELLREAIEDENWDKVVEAFDLANAEIDPFGDYREEDIDDWEK